MNSKTSLITKSPALKTFAMGVCALAASIATVSANLTVDLRASAIDPTLGILSNGGKSVGIIGTSGNITLDVWAQVTSTTPIAGAPFGLASLLGSIKSSSTAVTGTLSTATIGGPWNVSNQIGNPVELSTTPDGIRDLGSNNTVVDVNFIKFRKDPTSGGTQVNGATFEATNQNSAGATFQAITNGFEFFMGTVTFNISNFTSGTGSASLNWVIPAFSTAANKGQIATWTQADNLNDTGASAFASMFVGSPVSLAAAVPEPSAFGMLALGAFGLVGFRRMGLRRTA